MGNFIVFNPNVHRSAFLDLSEEYFTWMAQELQNNYNIDAHSMITIPLRDFIENSIDEFTSSISTDGIFYLIQVKDKIVGMGALRKLKEDIGEIKRMYIRPAYRVRGYGKQMLNKLLQAGREFGCTSFLLETSKFMTVAQHIYRSAGFVEREEYPESETPTILRQYQLFMEKKQ